MAETEILYFREWTIPGFFGCEKLTMLEISGIAEQYKADPERILDMASSVAEACLNALEHGGSAAAGEPVVVQLTVETSRFRIRVADKGLGFAQWPPAQVPSYTWGKDIPRGWGLRLIKELADEVDIGAEDGKFYIEMHFFRH